MIALSVEGLVVERAGRRLLDGVNLDVPRGAWVSVVGPNGAGKTTLVHVIAGVTRPDAGRVTLFDHDAAQLKNRQRARLVALVPQTPVIPPGARVLDYVLLGRSPHIAFLGTETNADIARAHDVLRLLDVDDLAVRSVETLSGGERQRVLLARALLQDAELLLLDEPTTALDIGHQQEVLEIIETLRRDHALTVISTLHDLTLAGLYADELVLLDGGRIAERGTAHDVLTAEHLHRHFGARVSVLAGADGPVVVPYRIGANGGSTHE
jgi:iron complex transport system ATP-binding protein